MKLAKPLPGAGMMEKPLVTGDPCHRASSSASPAKQPGRDQGAGQGLPLDFHLAQTQTPAVLGSGPCLQ